MNQRSGSKRTPDVSDVLRELAHLRAELAETRCELATIGSILMAMSAKELELIASFRTATDQAAARLQAAVDALASDDEEFNAAVKAEIDWLKGVGANPATPIPTPPVEPPTP